MAVNYLIHLLGLLVPKPLRAGWREEWRAEVQAVRQSRGRMAALRFAASAPVDALSSRWTTRERPAWKSAWEGAWGSDLKHTLRSIAKSPGHVLTVSLCLGIGIAVCTAVFSILNAFMYGGRPGMDDRARLPRLFVQSDEHSADASLEEFAVLAAGTPHLTGIAAEGRQDFSIHVPGHEPMHVVGAFVNGEFFQTLGTRPLAGRLLSPADDRAEAPLAVVLSHAFWKGRLGSPPDLVGRSIVLGNRDAVVAGIAPERFTGLASDDDDGAGGFKVYVPLAHARTWPGVRDARAPWLNMAGRVRGEFDAAALTAEMQPLATRLETMNPERRRGARIVPVANGLTPGTGSAELVGMMLLMMAAPLTVLAIGCANVANLQLVRASLRSRELAVRASLGASRGQIVRLLTMEAALLAASGFAVGLLLLTVLLRIAELVFPIPVDIDLRVLFFSAGVAVMVVGATGLLPALAVTRGRTADGLRSGGRSIAGGNSRIRRGLVVAQVSLCFLLLLTAAVFTRGLLLLTDVIPSHAAEVTVTEIRFDIRNYEPAARRRLLDQLEARLRADNRVVNVGLTSVAPMGYEESRVWLPDDAPDALRWERSNHVTSTFFETANIPILRGRIFRPGEAAVVVDDAFIARNQLHEPVLGQSLRVAFDGGTGIRMATIVGVAGAVSRASVFGDPPPMLYIPLDRAPMYVGVWIRAPHASAMSSVARETLAEADPDLPAVAIRTLQDYYQENAAPLANIARAATGLGSVALLLAVSGLYSVVAFFVALRMNEFGIRIALGARAGDIGRMVVGQAGRLTLSGLALGAILGTPLLVALHAAFPFTEPFDPFVIVPVALTLGFAALAAAWLPARRASFVDPVNALRAE
jgi:predicted permease